MVSRKNDANGYYTGRIICDILPLVSRFDGIDASTAAEELNRAKQGSQKGNEGSFITDATLILGEGFLLPSLATGYAELLVGSKELDLILNGLVSSISGIIVSPTSGSAFTVTGDGLPKLTTLNTLCEVDDTFWSRVKEFRIVMLLKTLLNWPSVMDRFPGSWVVSTEILRLLRSLLPWIKHIDGDFWGKTLNLLNEAFEVRLADTNLML